MAESTAYARRGYSGAAKDSTLVSGITSGATSLDAGDLSTWTAADDSGPGRATITDGTNEEEVEFTAVSGNSLTGLTRGVGGTTAQAWSPGVTISHRTSVRDFDEANYWVSELASAVGASNTVLVGDGDNSLAGLSVAASRIVARLASGDLKACTPDEIITLLALDTGDVSGLAEFIRDTIGTALTAGSNVTITPNDGADTITIAASAGSASEHIWIPGYDMAVMAGSALGAIDDWDGVLLIGTGTTTEGCKASRWIPTGWSTVNLTVVYANVGPDATGTIRFEYVVRSRDAGLELDSPPATGVTSAAAGAANIAVEELIASGVSVTAGSATLFEIFRDPDHAGDTIDNDILIVGLLVAKAS